MTSNVTRLTNVYILQYNNNVFKYLVNGSSLPLKNVMYYIFFVGNCLLMYNYLGNIKRFAHNAADPDLTWRTMTIDVTFIPSCS